jgi:hypothetical protein
MNLQSRHEDNFTTPSISTLSHSAFNLPNFNIFTTPSIFTLSHSTLNLPTTLSPFTLSPSTFSLCRAFTRSKILFVVALLHLVSVDLLSALPFHQFAALLCTFLTPASRKGYEPRRIRWSRRWHRGGSVRGYQHGSSDGVSEGESDGTSEGISDGS